MCSRKSWATAIDAGCSLRLHITEFSTLQNNPQGTRILANEFLASRLGLWLGLPVAQVEVIEVSDWLIEHAPELRMDFNAVSTPCRSGLHVGSRYACDPLETHVLDYLPESMLAKAKNIHDFAR